MVSKLALAFLVLVVLFVCACPKDPGDRGNHAAPDLGTKVALADRLYPMPNLAPATAAERRLHVLALVRRGCYLGHNPSCCWAAEIAADGLAVPPLTAPLPVCTVEGQAEHERLRRGGL